MAGLGELELGVRTDLVPGDAGGWIAGLEVAPMDTRVGCRMDHEIAFGQIHTDRRVDAELASDADRLQTGKVNSTNAIHRSCSVPELLLTLYSLRYRAKQRREVAGSKCAAPCQKGGRPCAWRAFYLWRKSVRARRGLDSIGSLLKRVRSLRHEHEIPV